MVDTKRLGQDQRSCPGCNFHVRKDICGSSIGRPKEYPGMTFHAGSLVSLRSLTATTNVADLVKPEAYADGVVESESDSWLVASVLAKANQGRATLGLAMMNGRKG